MKVDVWGTRGSIASAGPETIRYGGNTVCISVSTSEIVCILDAGTGIRRAGSAFSDEARPVHILLSHLHMDHIQGLGFFAPLFEPGREVHVWGPPTATRDLRARLTRYLSPPLFPVRIRDLDSHVTIHDAPTGRLPIDALDIDAMPIIHAGPTLGYRLHGDAASLAYLPDHEVALGGWGDRCEWISGYDLAAGADVLFHDAQYTADEYEQRVGWGHSCVQDAATFADVAEVDRLLLFHHDPSHDDVVVDQLAEEAREIRARGAAEAAYEGLSIDL